MPDSNTDRHWSRLYDDGQDFTLATSGVLTKLLSFTDGTLSKNCLDIGCGTGQLSRELYHRGYVCMGVDAAAGAIKLACSLTTTPESQLHYIHFDIERDDLAKLPRQLYSLITCKLVYAFIQDKAAFLDKVRSLLRPDGIFAVITPHVDDVPPERHGIAVGDNDLKLLSERFTQLALYKGSERDGALTYFVGC